VGWDDEIAVFFQYPFSHNSAPSGGGIKFYANYYYLSLFSSNASLSSRPQLIIEYYVP
jgi:hypothetical protein